MRLNFETEVEAVYLKALEIQGFKSFPDKTILSFGEDITAIVGPNGSGKSNISDAIRWVMGEQSTKSLRGAKMEDVIFGGTAKRPPQGFAQVTLVLDNTEHILPTMEEAEIAVTRRYYRSGESEYYINRQSVRLRDVVELFLDTGMGKEGYALIGQGKIDEILSTKSEDRREIFEEAAGISKYRHRKEEAERKLERTEENLLRIDDKIAELELQVVPLREQAEKAKRYLLLRDELRSLEISVWLTNLDEVKAETRKLEISRRAAEEDRERSQRQLEQLYAEGEACGEKMRNADMETEKAREALAEVERQITEQRSAVTVLEAGIAHSRENIALAEKELQERDSRTGSLQRQLEEQERRIREIGRREQELSAQVQELLRQAVEQAAQAEGEESETAALRHRAAEAAAAAADAKGTLLSIEAENGQLLQRRNAAEAEARGMEVQRLEAAAQLKEAQQALETAREEVTAAENVISGYRLRLEEREKKYAAATEQKTRLTVETGAVENRVRLLREMERDYEGFSRAVKSVMQAKGTLRGIHGPVASLMKVEQTYSVAIEVALGSGLQNIVVDREEDAKAAIGYLKRRDGGRATFLPLTAIRGEELREPRLNGEFGFLGIASQLVRFDSVYQSIFQSLLGRTVIVEDLDCGITLSRKYQNRFRIVTLDGQVINRGGSMTGGSISRNAGVLSRAAELERLDGQCRELREKLTAAAAAEEALHRDCTAVQYELDAAQGRQRTAENEVLRLEGQTRHYQVLAENLQKSGEERQREVSALADRLQENQIRSETAKQELAKQETEQETCQAAIAQRLSGQAARLEESERLADEISARKTQLAELHTEKEVLGKGLQDLRELNRQLSGDRMEKERQLQGYRQQIQSAEQEIRQYEENASALSARAEEWKDRLTALGRQRMELEAERTAKNRAGQEMNETLLNAERSASRLEQKVAAAAMEEKQILDRLWDRYELNHTDAQAQRIELESLSRAGRRIGELKRDMSALGTPNLGAVEEYERVNTRYTYLSGQKNDVEQAKTELRGVIGEITSQMTRIFAEQFHLLQQSFQETFQELFGGGQAALELEDATDILNCGIEIKAQPPGKTLKSITLLSGGEKAFVAIALYFAILKVHPTPFCVLDEIEAALDDANVNRYIRYMRRLTGRTQFIVITHRRGTMEGADVLYGVTMQEQGVSKVLTIHMNDLAKELNIK